MTDLTSEKASPSSLEIIARAIVAVRARRYRWASALRWGSDGVITAADAIGHRDPLPVYGDFGERRAEVAGLDPTTDIALLRLLEPSPSPVNWTAAQPDFGEQIKIVGREPRGPTVNAGSIRLAGSAWTSQRGGRIDRRIELDVAWYPAMEGAAVVNEQGALIGMAVPGPRGRVLCIPTATISRVAGVLEARGRIPQPYLGVRLQPLLLTEPTRMSLALPTDTRSIAVISSVEADSPAAIGGARLGDWVLGANGVVFPAADGLVRLLAERQVGDAIQLNVWRAGASERLDLRVGERPSA
jgi:S1-C subfamily serine protease